MHLELAVCPVCKTTAFHELADARAIRRQVEELWAFHIRRLKPGAPPHHLFDRAAFSQPHPVHIVQCNGCGTVLRNPRETEDALVALYAKEEPPASALDALFAQQACFFEPRVRLMERLLGRTGTVLEVASYIGAFLYAATQREWKAEGIDINESANAFARKRGCRIRTGSIEDVAAERSYDVVAFWNVFDQLPEPERALRHARSLLQPGGLLALRVPNGGFYAAMLRLRPAALRTELLALNNLLAFPYRHGFTAAALEKLLEATGFQIRMLRGDTLVPTASEWTAPWAALEEKAVKTTMRALLRRARAPWLDVYATVV